MFRKCLFAAIIACVPALSQAYECPSWYVKGIGGLNFLSIPAPSGASIETNIGYAVGGAFGYRFPRVLRLEGELAYRNNNLDHLLIKEYDVALKFDADISSFTYMANIFFDLPVNWLCVPYIGGGLGGYREWGNGNIPALKGTPYDARIKFKQNGVAYQIIGGLNIWHCRHIDAGIEYHFLDALTNSESGYNHTLAATCRYAF